MCTLDNFFIQEEDLAPCIMRAQPFCLIGPHFLANLEFLIHRIYELEHSELDVHPTSQLSKLIGAFGNLAPKLFEVCESPFNGLPHFLTKSTMFPTIVITNNGAVKIHFDMILVPI
jgi:hypothetical protein